MTAPAKRVRAVVLCVCEREGRILVFEGYDSQKPETFYRPLGGTIEFGERSEQAVRREFQEEIGSDLDGLRYLGTLESLFIHEGGPGHEIVLVYDGHLVEERIYQMETFTGNENEEPLLVKWKRLEEFGPGGDILYPDGLLELLRGQGAA